jgi:hypothetical protein
VVSPDIALPHIHLAPDDAALLSSGSFLLCILGLSRPVLHIVPRHGLIRIE